MKPSAGFRIPRTSAKDLRTSLQIHTQTLEFQICSSVSEIQISDRMQYSATVLMRTTVGDYYILSDISTSDIRLQI